MYDYITGVLRDAGIELANVAVLTILIFLGIIVPLLAAFYILKRRLSGGATFKIKINVNPQRTDMLPRNMESLTVSKSSPPKSNVALHVAKNSGNEFDPRQFLKTVYKILMFMVATFLFAGAFFSWQAATPANQLLLVSGILALLSLMAFLSIGKLDRQDITAEEYRNLLGDLLDKVQVSTSFSAPQVQRIDSDTLRRAQQKFQDGTALDDVCRSINGDFDSWDKAQQKTFQQVLKAAIEQIGSN